MAVYLQLEKYLASPDGFCPHYVGRNHLDLPNTFQVVSEPPLSGIKIPIYFKQLDCDKCPARLKKISCDMLYKKLPGSYAPARYYRNHQLQFINFINHMHANCFKYQISVIKQRNSPTLSSLISDA